ncbi:hypothetical protein G7A66_06135 [Altererythrobacter sp. SALINAS58]|uniref:hypothetical protein n=1 Tax=Alteripontixanthobacter muriae TaxID=2705546 RepID=UPI0015759D5B|nr:hypothetical protein [Alteripontixanthobacter muriae]NTZ42670.1 hypothetical protein [Alteripontixanthobacter muriae]
MTTTNMDELLVVALQDLREGRLVILHRLPDVAAAVRDEAVRGAFDQLIARADDEKAQFAGMSSDPGGEPNLWAGGILDDACRDASSNAAGPVRDVALIGAIRKLLASDIVSLETAIVLSRSGNDNDVAALEDMRQAGVEANEFLGEQLPRLTRA